jgi:hypothetical protein
LNSFISTLEFTNVLLETLSNVDNLSSKNVLEGIVLISVIAMFVNNRRTNSTTNTTINFYIDGDKDRNDNNDKENKK